ncbi:MAG TPA: thiamine pyrophosphate-binding protein [Verrucomicrobiae bacterium]|nr:thiamine pyrophosphate-binding protein [Verrucomicrobiae bacterium]
MKCSDYIADFIAQQGVNHVFTVSGAGDLHLLDSVRKHPSLQYFCNHHEQACSMAAYSYSCVTENLGVALVTTGPGSTNAITGLCSAWTDSVPVLFISGQVKRRDTIGMSGVRQRGIQEINIIPMVRPVTKYAEMVTDPNDIRFHLEQSVHSARTGRPGPVWLDIPMDVQSSPIEPDRLRPFVPPAASASGTAAQLAAQCARVVELLQSARRPVLLAGYGIEIARARREFDELVDRLNIPVLGTWHAVDLIASDHPLFVGRPGIFGQRAGNFAIQSCDLLLSIGSRLSIPQTGYDSATFARAAKKVYVDIDPAELGKFDAAPDLPICADAGDFIRELLRQLAGASLPSVDSWRKHCRQMRERYPTALPEYTQQVGTVNSYTLVDVLSEELGTDELIIPGASGTGFTCTHQALKTKRGQRVFTSNGFAEMGFDLPGAIGACVGAKGKRTILISGDGSIQMNIQELQTIVHHQLPIKLFYLNNRGYLTIRHSQTGMFGGELSGSSPETGVSMPDIQKLGTAYGLTMFRVSEYAQLRPTIQRVLESPGPAICEVVMDPQQPLVPRTSSRLLPSGQLVSPPLEDLYPFLPREEMKQNMLIPLVEETQG